MTVRQTPSTAIVAIALLTVYILFGSSFAAIKIVLDGMPPFLALAVRFIVAGALLYAWTNRQKGQASDRAGLEHWKSAFFIGGTVIVGGIGGVAFAEQFLPSGIAALLVSSAPVWAVLIRYGVSREGISWSTAAGLVLGLAGLVMLIRPTGAEHISLVGAGVAIAAAILWALGSVYAPRVPLPRRPLASASMQMLAAGLILLAAAIGTGDLSRLNYTWQAGVALFYLTIFSSLVGYVAYTWLLSEVPITVSSTVAYVAPVVAVLTGWILLREHIAQSTLLAAGVILLGVVLMMTNHTESRSQPSRRATPLPAGVPASNASLCDCR